MANLAVTNTFTAGTTAVAAQVNTNFSDVATYVNNRNAGSAKWDALAVAGDTVLDGTLTVGGVNIGYNGTDGWSDPGETWTYASATQFLIAGDKTGVYNIGDKIKLTQTTVKYFYIKSISYSSPNTSITVYAGSDYTLANATITSPYYSKASSPNGFPRSFSWTPTWAGFSVNPTGSGKISISEGNVFITYVSGSNGTSNNNSFNIESIPTFASPIGELGIIIHGGTNGGTGFGGILGLYNVSGAFIQLLQLDGTAWTTSGAKMLMILIFSIH